MNDRCIAQLAAGVDLRGSSWQCVSEPDAAGKGQGDRDALLRRAGGDGADSGGLTVSSVTVTARWDPAGYWYPARAEIRAEGPEEGIRKLKQVLEAELGIPAAEQIWSGDDG